MSTNQLNKHNRKIKAKRHNAKYTSMHADQIRFKLSLFIKKFTHTLFCLITSIINRFNTYAF